MSWGLQSEFACIFTCSCTVTRPSPSYLVLPPPHPLPHSFYNLQCTVLDKRVSFLFSLSPLHFPTSLPHP